MELIIQIEMNDNNQPKHQNNPIAINDQLKPNIYLPTPFPERIDRNASKQQQNHNTSSQAQYKRELNDLEAKYASLLKLTEKDQKKYKSQKEESKALKSTNELLSKDLLILQKTNERIIADKFELDSLLEDSKAYTRRLETKLVSGAKNQFLIEINSKLKEEISQSSSRYLRLKEENENLIEEIHKKDREMAIYQKALELKSEELKKKNIDCSPDALYQIGISKEQFDSIKTQNTALDNTNKQLKDLSAKDQEKIGELLFSVDHLTSIVASKETELAALGNERDLYKNDHCKVKKERDLLRTIIKSKAKEEKAIESDLKEETTHYLNIISQLESQLKQNEASTNEANVQIALLNNTVSVLTKKYNTLEQSFKLKTEETEKLKAENDIHKRTIKELTEQVNQLKPSNAQLNQFVTELNEQIHSIEKENIELLAKNKSLIFSFEKSECDLIKQNQSLNFNEIKLKDQVDKLNKEIESLREERQQYKSTMSEIESRSRTLQLEKMEIEQNLNSKALQIERLKENNNFLHKTLSNNTNSNHNKTEEEKNSQGNDDWNKRDQSGSRNILDEIRKLKSNMRDMLNNQSKAHSQSDS